MDTTKVLGQAYRPRVIDAALDRALAAAGAVVIEGARASGKTMTAVDQIDTDAVGEPAFRLVVTGTGPVLTADDGTVISPLSALEP